MHRKHKSKFFSMYIQNQDYPLAELPTLHFAMVNDNQKIIG